MPTASVSTAAAVKPFARPRPCAASRRSCRVCSSMRVNGSIAVTLSSPTDYSDSPSACRTHPLNRVVSRGSVSASSGRSLPAASSSCSCRSPSGPGTRRISVVTVAVACLRDCGGCRRRGGLQGSLWVIPWKARRAAASAVAAVGLVAWVQGNFIVGGMSVLDGQGAPIDFAAGISRNGRCSLRSSRAVLLPSPCHARRWRPLSPWRCSRLDSTRPRLRP